MTRRYFLATGRLELRELKLHSGLIRDFAGRFVDYRYQRYVEHTIRSLLVSEKKTDLDSRTEYCG